MCHIISFECVDNHLKASWQAVPRPLFMDRFTTGFGQVLHKFLTGLRQVLDRFRTGSTQTLEKFTTGFGQVRGTIIWRFTTGFGQVSFKIRQVWTGYRLPGGLFLQVSCKTDQISYTHFHTLILRESCTKRFVYIFCQKSGRPFFWRQPF